MNNPKMTAGEAADLVAAIFDRGIAMRGLIQQRQQARSDMHRDDGGKKPMTREQYAAKLQELDVAEDANLEDVVVDVRRLAVGAAGALFRMVEALETLAGPPDGK